MAGETISFEQAADAAGDVKREQSTIAFPYLDLDAAAEVARAIYNRSGLSSCDLDELAAEMGQTMSGAFRLKTGTAKTFDLVERDGKSGIKLSDLGRQIVAAESERSAKAESFMRVPLYAAIYERYKGHLLPPMKALEREMLGLGVSSKQTDKARQAFERSAKQAGFFEAGEDRLVRPRVETRRVDEERKVEDDRDTEDAGGKTGGDSGGSGGGGGGGKRDPLIDGLIKRLPTSGSKWDDGGRSAWLRLAVTIFDVIYEGGTDTIEIKPKTAAAH